MLCVLLCLLLGIAYAWLMYRQTATHLNPALRRFLMALRALAIALIAFLLVDVLWLSTSNRSQKPLVLVLADNSASVRLFKQAGFNLQRFATQLQNLKQQLGADYDVRYYRFDSQLSPGYAINFTGQQTNIAAALQQLGNSYAGQNLGAVVLATDGVYNAGASPLLAARNLQTTLYALALGDTLVRKDLLIANLNYNRTAFLGNDFMLDVLVNATKAARQTSTLQVMQDGQPVASQVVNILNDNFSQTISIKLHASKKGWHQYRVRLTALANEASVSNNVAEFYNEVIDGRQQILLLYGSPHPDVAALQQAIGSNANLQLKVAAASGFNAATLKNYSAVILHQYPAVGQPVDAGLLNAIHQQKLPVWFMAGGQSNWQQLNNLQQVARQNSYSTDLQETLALPLSGFEGFALTDSCVKQIPLLPPLLAQYGSYSLKPGAVLLLKQKIGRVETSFPLWGFADDAGTRQALLCAEGLWKWRLAEYASTGKTLAVDELVSQTLQYLTAKSNRDRLRVYPAKQVFDQGEAVILNAELYNDALELINTPEIHADLKSSTQKTYSFAFSRAGLNYVLNAAALPAGQYTFTANTQLAGKTLSTTGMFSVKAQDAETRQSTANHALLRQLATQNNGQMLQAQAIDKLPALIKQNNAIKTLIYTDKRYSAPAEHAWLLVLIIVLLTAEWFLRKREGLV